MLFSWVSKKELKDVQRFNSYIFHKPETGTNLAILFSYRSGGDWTTTYWEIEPWKLKSFDMLTWLLFTLNNQTGVIIK